jgi:hypothetical protein
MQRVGAAPAIRWQMFCDDAPEFDRSDVGSDLFGYRSGRKLRDQLHAPL